MKLVIVESPAKAKTIEKILGKDYKVVSSFGHIRDLAKDGDKNTGIDVEKNYKPHYVVPNDKKKVVAELTRLVAKSSEVVLATDEDREGEAISWHLAKQLKLDTAKTKRIVFTEITPEAIGNAIKNPRTIDKNLVDAQQARRILDRLVGFDLSGLLWKKVRGKLSAGRVQSVAVKLIVEREREIKNFKPEKYFKVTAVFTSNKVNKDAFKAELSENLPDAVHSKTFLEKCKKADYKVTAITVSPQARKPFPPFTTSTLQQSAAIKLGFSVSRTMQNAQRLYEAGHITYMRTDSTNLSNAALAQMAGFIEKEYGKKYLQVRKYTKQSKNAQEAHEAIRPTYVSKTHVTSDRDQQKLYDL
ncbi:MAG: DNA topoisomerase I, partial [Bacteroidetes bacterium RIFCSPHIGHO2_02_FULL_44_7]